jgi:hypothetical protein
MIVLAVTGALFAAIATTLNGRQNEAEFIHAINDAKAQIQQVINQASASYYPDQNEISCAVSGSTLTVISPSNVSQGTNQPCVFLGSVLQFAVGQTVPESYRAYTVVGISCTPQSGNCTSTTGSPFQNVDPTVGDFSYTSGALEYGLTAKLTSGSNSTGAVGFLMEPGSLSTTSIDGYSSGAQPVDLVVVNSGLGQTAASDVVSINKSLDVSSGLVINPSSGWQICLVSGGTNQSGLITIGSSGGTLQVTLSIKGNQTCT